MTEFQTVSESELQSIEGGVALGRTAQAMLSFLTLVSKLIP